MLLKILLIIIPIFCLAGIVFSAGVLYGFQTYRAIEDEYLKESIKINKDYIEKADERYKRNMKILNEAQSYLQRAQELSGNINTT